MFGRLDDLCLLNINRLASYFQEQLGFTMPAILRQAATGAIMATVLAIISTFLMRTPVILAITLFFGAITIGAFVRLLSKYNRDADRDWNSDLARDYAVRAIGATEGQRNIRVIGLIFSVISLVLLASISTFRAFDMVDLSMLLLIVSSMIHLYLSCAEPKPPGTHRREAKLAFAGQR